MRKVYGGYMTDEGNFVKDDAPPVVRPKPKPIENLSIDGQLHIGLVAIARMMETISEQSECTSFSRETVQNLKDLMTMLSDLKKKEADVLSKMSDEDLRKFLE